VGKETHGHIGADTTPLTLEKYHVWNRRYCDPDKLSTLGSRVQLEATTFTTSTAKHVYNNDNMYKANNQASCLSQVQEVTLPRISARF
jgi:hypothetical protein